VLIFANVGEDCGRSRASPAGESSRASCWRFGRWRRQRAGKTLIFDEIDAGIGGRVADVVGRSCAHRRSFQVLCITHLPQIAAAGHVAFPHLEAVRTAARTPSRRLDERQRVEELARMIGGAAPPMPPARARAAELLEAKAKLNQKRKRQRRKRNGIIAQRASE
jgi:DNA repair protein RecN (Recombination protein N)